MKRSRAIYLLTAAISNLGLTNSPDYDVYDPPTLEQGEKLLNIIEKSLKMLPPTILVETTFNKQFGKVKKNEWEPEDG